MSQSNRRGSAITAASNPHVALPDLAHRGQWSLESFSTLMEYICETSHGDQKIGRALSGWENPQLHVHCPSLSPLSSLENGSYVPEFVTKLFEFTMNRLTKRSFADAMAASLLMYLDDTTDVCENHSLHICMISVANGVFNSDDDKKTLQILKLWGRKIRSKFIMDNLTQLKP